MRNTEVDMDNKTESYTRTDLACEWARGGKKQEGTHLHEQAWKHGSLQSLRICTEEASRRLERPVGEYVTVTCGPIWRLDKDEQEELEGVVARVLSRMLRQETKKPIDGCLEVLVIGLGNSEITADAVGPQAVRELLVTRHLKEQEPDIFRRMECCAVSALAPGVLGQTGMEVAEVVAGAVRRCHPDAIVAIDALAARSCDRLAATVQLSNAGIAPGSGIGNDRCALDQKSLGVPVIALGIPTVVDSSTLVYDALRQAGIGEVDERLKKILENGRRFYVSPKESDMITSRTALLVAHAINRALVGVATLH
ncbi:MAG: GPR endopeptidase [Clostridia bacterium]|nr:GPR endopeptidase [Clostridia bacterium]